VEAWHDQGAYGAVYRAVRVGDERSGPVALKLSVHPWDARLAREGELLSRLSHPCIPRLLDRGLLRAPARAEHPWFVMPWIEGSPLYAWAAEHAPSHLELCRLLAHLARALEALHAAGAVHRDVKGDNILVRLSDSFPFLIDFGSAHFQGARRLTWQSLPPGTPAYQSPQAALFELRLVRQRDAYYAPAPADDLYALGVTAYRLVMGHYPPELQPHQDEAGCWHVTSPDPRPLLENNPRVEPLLREWIVRLLSDEPAARGTAAELAKALEAATKEKASALRPELQPATESVAPEAQALSDRLQLEPQPAAEAVASQVQPPAGEVRPESHPAAEVVAPQVQPPTGGVRPATEMEVSQAQAPAEGGVFAQPPRTHARRWAWRPWLALTAAGVSALLLWISRAPGPEAGPPSTSLSRASDSQAPDAGAAAVGDSSSTASPASAQPSSEPKRVAQEPPPEPRPGQLRPDTKGRCPGPMQVAINGGCWLENPTMTAEACVKGGYVLVNGKCYGPALAPPRNPRPTSGPTEAR
jgi:serine/threonine protein kinase